MTRPARPPRDSSPPSSGAGGPPSLLAVFAHPDDESLASGGLLAWCAAVGVRVSLLCLTHGEHGHAGRGAPAPRTRSLRQVRAGELRAAAEVLGVAGVRLLDHEDGMLPWIPPGRLDADILDEIRRAAPDVVITFDADGLYWHPDHIAVHERTTAVVAALGAGAPALFHVTLPPGAMRAVVDHAARVAAVRGLAPPFPRTILGVGDADAFGAGAPPDPGRGRARPRGAEAAGIALPPQPARRLRSAARRRSRCGAAAGQGTLSAIGDRDPGRHDHRPAGRGGRDTDRRRGRETMRAPSTAPSTDPRVSRGESPARAASSS